MAGAGDDLVAGLAAYALRRGTAAGAAKAAAAAERRAASEAAEEAAAAVGSGTTLEAAEEAALAGSRFRWPSSAEPLVPAVVAQNLPAGLGSPPEPLLAAFGGRVRGAELVAGGGPCRKARDSVHLELLEPVPLSQLGALQADARKRFQEAGGALAARAEALDLVPGRVELGAAAPAEQGVTVVDTDAVSMLFKGDSRGPPLRELLSTQKRKLISFQTVAELHAWILLRHFPAAKIERLEELLADFEVVWPDDLTCLLWAQLMDYGRAHGRPAGAQDCWVAAAALRHGASLCTVNLKDYDYLPGLRFLSPNAPAAALESPASLGGGAESSAVPAVVRSLRAGAETLATLAGRCRVVRSERRPSLVLLKAFQQLRGADDVLADCRGMVLDEAASFEVAAFPYRAFFNAGEPKAPSDFDWSTARVYEKSDGSLCTLYHYGGSWEVATQGSPDGSSSVAEGGEGPSFAEVFWRTWRGAGYRLPEEQCGMCFFFELLAPENRVVVPPPEPAQLVLHGARDLTTFSELRPEPLAERWGWRSARALEAPAGGWSLSAVKALAQNLSCTEGEGFVVVDDAFRRLKVKSPRYVLAAHLPRPNWGWSDGLDQSAHDKAVASLVLRGEGDEFCAYFPEWADRFRLWHRRMTLLSERLEAVGRGGCEKMEAQLSAHERAVVQAVKSSREPLAWNALLEAPMKGILAFCKRLDAEAPTSATAPSAAARGLEGSTAAPPKPNTAKRVAPVERELSARAEGAALALSAPSSARRTGGASAALLCAAAAALLAAAARGRLRWPNAGLASGLLAALAALLRARSVGRSRGRCLRGSASSSQLQRLAEGGPFSAAQLAKISALDAFLRRLSQSPQREAFVLRGGLLTRQLARPAARNADDLDFLALFPWDATGAEAEARVRAVLALPSDDGVSFDAAALTSDIIWEETDSPGVRLTFSAELWDGQRFPVQADVAFNDPVQPAPAWLQYRPVLGEPFPVLAAVAETMFGWKLHGLFERNTTDEGGHEHQGLWRPKDLHDLLLLVQSGRLDASQLMKSIDVAFSSRGSTPDLALRLIRKTFGSSKGSQRIWRSWREKHLVPDEVPSQLHEAVGALGDYLKPIFARRASSDSPDLRALDETATVTQLPGKADVAKFAKKVEVTEDLVSFGLQNPGSTVRFCGRADEFEVDAVKAPKTKSKRGPDGADASVHHRGWLMLRQPPYFTAKACSIELVSRPVPDPAPSEQQ